MCRGVYRVFGRKCGCIRVYTEYYRRVYMGFGPKMGCIRVGGVYRVRNFGMMLCLESSAVPGVPIPGIPDHAEETMVMS